MSSLPVLIDLLILIGSAIAAIHIQLDRFTQSKGFDLMDATGFRVRKYNRTTSVLDGHCEILRDLGDEYQFTMTVAYSRLGNNQFNEYPLKIAKATICTAMNGPYKDYQILFKNTSNLPQVGDEWLCPFPLGRYWIKDLAPESRFIPRVVHPGYWRFTFEILDSKDNVVIQYFVYLHIKTDMF